MPVTIGSLTSNVTLTDTTRRFSEETLDQIARLVAVRIKREQESEAAAREEGQIPDRMSES
jgi:hypothetical protein